ncbi:Proton pump-interactor 1 [Vitis vinifera]|uniref:Proton pump-interactor 1 n=1 Tax=Vitis vinifera TaxID=29760 RepID=A0A438CFF4_VITVI|nr:Proton pump-interactor 1 [Vitis vinifera]
MGVEVVGFEAAPAPVEAGTEAESALLHDKENGNSIKDPELIKRFKEGNQARFQITEGLRAKKSDRAQMLSQLKSLKAEDEQFRMIVDGKRKEMEPLQHALGKLRSTNSANRERGGTLCSSEEELNDLIQSLHYHMQHESIPLAEEKQILREIKQLEATREKVIAGAAMRAKIQDSLGQKEAIQDQGIDSEIDSLMEELKAVSEKRDKAYEGLTRPVICIVGFYSFCFIVNGMSYSMGTTHIVTQALPRPPLHLEAFLRFHWGICRDI